jgi:hypothetical protein
MAETFATLGDAYKVPESEVPAHVRQDLKWQVQQGRHAGPWQLLARRIYFGQHM